MVVGRRVSLFSQLCYLVFIVFAGSVAAQLVKSANVRISKALRSRTASMYDAKFNTFLAFTMWHQLQWEDIDTVLVFLEFLVQPGSKAHTLTSYVSVLRHFFQFV